MTPLLLLAEKVEGLERGDGDVNDMIAVAIGWQRPMVHGLCGPSFPGRHRYRWHDADRMPQGFHPPRYTTSVDNALLLVPEGYDYDVGRHGEDLHCARVWRRGYMHDADSWCAATPALALVAASLRARAAMEAGE